jgi:dCTP deaminase
MILSDNNIKLFLKNNNLMEFKSNIYIGSASVDLTLSNSFTKIVDYEIIKFDQKVNYKSLNINEYLLEPGAFILASTVEKINLPNNISAFVQGKSSIGRLGLQIQNAGFIDSGFSGQITLELHNQGPCPILLEAGKFICQVIFIEQKTPSTNPYNGKYQNQTGATGSRIHLDSSFSKKHGDVEYD